MSQIPSNSSRPIIIREGDEDPSLPPLELYTNVSLRNRLQRCGELSRSEPQSPALRLLNGLLCELREERAMKVRAAQFAKIKALNNSPDKASLLGLPSEVRLLIYKHLFEDAWLIYDPQSLPTFFRRENLPTGVLFVSSKIREEAHPVLFKYLIIDTTIEAGNFFHWLSPATLMGVKCVWNVRANMALGAFPNMNFWLWEKTGVLNRRMFSQFVALESRDLFDKVAAIYHMADAASINFLFHLGRRQFSACTFMGKFKVLACDHLEEDSGLLFSLGLQKHVCKTEHESIVSCLLPIR